jgi:hypothetical protein
VYDLIHIARKALKEKKIKKTNKLLGKVQTYLRDLGEGKLFGTQENETFCWLEFAYEGIIQFQNAKEYFPKATSGLNEPSCCKVLKRSASRSDIL